MDALPNRIHASLRNRRLSCGGWPFLRGSHQMALEPTCLALLALRGKPCANAQVLLDAQLPEGSWGSFATDDEASGLTGLALLTLNALGTFPERVGVLARRWCMVWPWTRIATHQPWHYSLFAASR